MSTDSVVERVTQGYGEEVAKIAAEHAGLVAALAAEVDAVGFDELRGFFEYVTGEAVGNLGADASNSIEDEEEQDNAIRAVEDWISENVSNTGTEANVACAFWYYGPEKAPQEIRARLSTSPAP